MNVRRQQPKTTRTAIAACRVGLSCASFAAYFGHESQLGKLMPAVWILVGSDWRGG
jgi:hypothetical protein